MDSAMFFFLILSQGLVNCFVFAVEENSTSSRSAYFMTRENKRLEGHVVKRLESASLMSCNHLCLRNSWCSSTNFQTPSTENGRETCELNKHGAMNTDSEFYDQQGVTFSMLLKGCLGFTGCLNGGSCVHEEKNKKYLCLCTKAWTGEKCERKIGKGWYSHNAAHSCKEIQDSGDSKGDGEYWIDPQNKGNPLKVYCDMTTDGGGWLLVSNVVLDNSSLSLYSTLSLQLSVNTSYRGIGSYHNNNTVLTKSAMNELQRNLSFTQLRFHCSKQQGRTFHVTTVANSTGEAVVQYFSGQSDVQPDACGSFVRMENDNSRLAGVCRQWGYQYGAYNVSKWGGAANQDRLDNHPAFAAFLYNWLLTPGGSRWECDDYLVGVSSGDFWKVFVR